MVSVLFDPQESGRKPGKHAAIFDRSDMEEHTARFSRERDQEGVPVRYFHRLGEEQWTYNAWLIDQISDQTPGLPDWRAKMHDAGRTNIRQRPESYRDTFPDEGLVAIAEADGKALSTAQHRTQTVC